MKRTKKRGKKVVKPPARNPGSAQAGKRAGMDTVSQYANPYNP
jgi:hypothetical protein